MGFAIGMKLGDFKVDGPLGRGGMATVLAATHVPTGLPAALKVALAGGAALEEFAREVHAVARMVHPGIVAVYDHGTTPAPLVLEHHTIPTGAPWLAMERLEGALRPPDVGSWAALRRALLALLAALGHAHARGVIHRDLKPDNILRRSDGEVVLSDFGIAHLTGTGHHVDGGSSSAGTPRYMAPEQFTGHEFDFGPPTDLYALGCVAWELATGAPPFEAPTALALGVKHVADPPPEFRPAFDLPDGFEAWLRRLLSKAPGDRFAFAAHAAHELRALADDESEPPAAPLALGKIAALGPGLFGIRELPVVGREAERGSLLQLAHRLTDSDPVARTVLIIGVAGVGKSKLAGWLTHQVHEDGLARTLTVDCKRDVQTELERGLGQLLGLRGMNREQAATRLTKIAPEGTETGHLPALFRDALTDGERLDELHAEPRRLATGLALELAATRHPLVLWLDDAVWSSEALVVAERISTLAAPILVLATARTEDTHDRNEETGRLLSLAGPNVLDVQPLGPRAGHDLVSRLLPLDDQAIRDVVERSGGNPLFAVQLVGDWVQRGVLRWSESGLRAATSERQTVPSDVRELWLARVDDVLWSSDGEDDRMALLIGAALGHTVDRRVWLLACQQFGVQPASDLAERLVRRRLAVWEDNGFSFTHGLLVDTLRAAVPPANATAIHLACGEALSRSRDWARLGDAGRHLLTAGQLERARETLLLAADGATVRQRYVEASELAAMARSAATDATDEELARLRLVELRANRNFTPLREFVVQATELADRARANGWQPILAGTLELRGPAQNGLGSPADAVQDLFEAADLYGALGERHKRTGVLTNLSYILSFADQTDEAVAIGEQALALAEALGRETGIATACDRLAFALRNVDSKRSVELKERGLVLAERQGLLELQGHLLDALGSAAFEAGEHERAIALYLDAERRFDAAHVPIVWMSRFHRGYVELLRGNVDEALALFEPASEVFEQVGVYNYVTYSRAALFACHALRGDKEAAGEWLTRVETALAAWHARAEMTVNALRLGAEALDGLDPGLAARARAL